MGKTYISSSGTAKELEKIYIGDENNLAKEIKRAYIGDSNGVARMVFGPPYGPEPILPTNYQQVEYIEGEGTQYLVLLKTGTYYNTNIKFEITWQLTTTSLSLPYGVCGIQNSPTIFNIRYTNDSTHKLQYQQYSGAYSTTHGPNLNKHTVILDFPNKTFTYDNDNAISIGNNSERQIKNFPVFTLRTNDSYYGDNKTKMKLYRFKLWSGSTLLHNLYPCYRKSDNVSGAFDMANNTFRYYNTTNPFPVGPDYIGEL